MVVEWYWYFGINIFIIVLRGMSIVFIVVVRFGGSDLSLVWMEKEKICEEREKNEKKGKDKEVQEVKFIYLYL